MNNTCMPRLIALVTRLVRKEQDGGESEAERRDLEAMIDTIGNDPHAMLLQASAIVDELHSGQVPDWLDDYRCIYRRACSRRMSDEELLRHQDTHTKENSWWTNDAKGIPLCRICDECEDAALAKYKPEVLGLGSRSYEDVVEEPIDEQT